MRFHGSVSITLIALAWPAFAQEDVPRLLGAPDAQLAPGNGSSRQPATPPPAALGSGGNPSMLENELEGLRSDLQSFHALSEEVSRSARDLESKAERVSINQRQEMLDLLTKVATQGISRKSTKETDAEAQSSKAATSQPDRQESGMALAVTDATVDPFALGKILFRSGDFAKAEQAFRRVTPNDDNRELVKYMIATCKYRRKQFPEALKAYQEIANSNDDSVVRDLAKFQLDGIRWRQDVDQELEQLRKQREKQSGGNSVPKPDDRPRR